MVSLKHELPIRSWKVWLSAIVIAVVIGNIADHLLDTRLDDIFHDAALVHHKRTHWQDTAIVALDSQIPGYVGRRQALGLFALATKRLFELGATTVFLDARLYEPTNNLYFANCVSTYRDAGFPHQIQWDDSPNRAVFADLTTAQFERFYIANPSFLQQSSLEVALLLQAYFGEQLIPADFIELSTNQKLQERLFAEVTIEPKDNLLLPGLNRWMNINPDSVVYKLSEKHLQFLGEEAKTATLDVERCGQTACKRTRFSEPIRTTAIGGDIPILPLSQLAGCVTDERLNDIRPFVEDRIVILQLSQPEEASDLLLTPMSNAIGSPRELLHGPQFIGDSLETHLNGDHPSRPNFILRNIVFLLTAICTVASAAMLKASVALIVPLICTLIVIALCFVFTPMHLWPVVATTITSMTGCFALLLAHITQGTQQSKLVARYLPPPVRGLLADASIKKDFTNQRHQAAVLMSDLRQYTTITTELEKPEFVFDLINRYFEDTTLMLQNQYHGWLEAYVGDMVVYYWPDTAGYEFEEQKRHCLLGAIELAAKQKAFFDALETLDINAAIPKSKLQKISAFIGAGIGVTTGEIVMGNLGPHSGVQKFSCLGDPLNLASRIEALTRHFNTEIIITEELQSVAHELGLKTRKLVTAEVKGRPLPVTLFAMGEASDERFSEQAIDNWQGWIADIERGKEPDVELLAAFEKIDKVTVTEWIKQGLLEVQRGVFVLTSK
ncbi:adenylate/guanylate cyclase domain-containing protein [Alteromonas facilis]|uniref:adenylate/guanylate cyclase domain-containing protein n=1 Tax=Alteromonas facilis TaxID=2048004 RepID=UPI000C290DAA|nr:adenylate/guanylate cyclase domain-containing protein [Alteromonas facilis]